MAVDDEIVQDVPPFFLIYKSGRIERLLGTDVVPAGLDPATGVSSQDVLIDPATNLTARLYLPPGTPDRPLPVLVYYHGGGFTIETAFSPTYHNYLNSLVADAGAIGVSVHYRRAPEHPLPAAYDDSLAALLWVASRPPEEPWLAAGCADLERLFLAGDSAGANIVHNIALRAAGEGLDGDGGAAIVGLLLAHPFFWGSELIGEEGKDPKDRAQVEGMWKFVCPGSTEGTDDPLLNPMAKGAPCLAALPCRRLLVAVAEKDILAERGRAYYEAVKGSGWEGEAQLLEAKGEEALHVFHLHNTKCDIASNMLKAFSAFLRSQ